MTRAHANTSEASEACAVEGVLERDHLDGAERSIPALVAGLRSCALDGLLDAVSREHAERDGHARRERDVRDALRDLAGDVVEVRGGAADHRGERDDAVDPADPLRACTTAAQG